MKTFAWAVGWCVVGELEFELRPMADRNELLTENMNIKRKISTVSTIFYLFKFFCESTVVAGIVSREVVKRWESSRPVPQCKCVASA